MVTPAVIMCGCVRLTICRSLHRGAFKDSQRFVYKRLIRWFPAHLLQPVQTHSVQKNKLTIK